MGEELKVGDIANVIALHLVDFAPDSVTAKQIKEMTGEMCSACSDYCHKNKIPNDVFA
jgi:hypothetical protein